ncbi:porin family protein [Tardiphaga alba]|uniref:Porin family protein n=1 Tax=Tardiphaga alba TaxID=340268 RepID=A0ABX8ABM5_9BRAD|nr:outer membrane beta-barrel protein [Tardiphaga alba]QUS41176.1 porin family protein [Tardiphaga alba]
MRSVKFIVAAGAASLMSTAVFAADMPIAPPPAMYAPPPVEDFGGWYLRGDIGMSNQQVKRLENSLAFPNQANGLGFDSAGIYGVGLGYQFNNWFRADVTGQYRGRANFHGSSSVQYGPGDDGANNYSGSKSELLFMANAYVDLGTWWCVTPFIGAGIGASYNRISGFRDDGVRSNNGAFSSSVTYFEDHGQWNMAWAAHAGLSYKVNPSLTLELAYSYVDLGSGRPGNFRAYDNSAAGASSIVLKDITSHDLKLGVRWNLDTPPPAAYAPPLMRKG